MNLVFPNAGDVPVTLTISNPYDSSAVTQTVTVQPDSGYFVLSTVVTPSAGGSVVRSPDQQAFLPGSEVTLTATPANGYTFSGWSGGGCSGTGDCTLTMNADTAVTATFAPIEYTLTVNSGSLGTVTRSPDQATYHYGDVVQLTAVPASTYSFSHWSGDLSGSSNPASVTIDGNKTINAVFVQGYTLAINEVGGGTVTKYPDQATYLPGQVVEVSAFPALNWELSAWSGDCTGSGTCVVTMNRNKAVTATFAKTGYNLDIVVTATGTTSSVAKES